MKQQDFVQMLRNSERFNEIKSVVTTDLPAFIVGTKCELTYQMHVATSAAAVTEYLDIFINDNLITNEKINKAFSTIDVKKKENVWLLMYYIEEQKAIENIDYYKVKIDISMIEKMLEKADPALKNDYTVLRIKERVKKKYGYDIKF